jgi:signal transduction histidine kinase
VAESRARAVIAGREARDREAVAGERARIAHELHDAVSHSVSVMVLQSGGVRRLLREDQVREREALHAIEETGRSVFAELRRVAGILADDDAQAPREPQPTVERVGELVERARDAGLDVDLRVEGTPIPVSPGLGVSAYRIVQEALTNTLKHTGGASVNVCVRYGQEDLCLDIVDDGRGTYQNGNGDGPEDAAGSGLLGMRERVALYGGALEAAPEPGGGFGVHARLPLKD